MSGDQASRLVVLDRDGVINRDSANFIRSADEWLPVTNPATGLKHTSAWTGGTLSRFSPTWPRSRPF